MNVNLKDFLKVFVPLIISLLILFCLPIPTRNRIPEIPIMPLGNATDILRTTKLVLENIQLIISTLVTAFGLLALLEILSRRDKETPYIRKFGTDK